MTRWVCALCLALAAPASGATVTLVHALEGAETILAADLDADGWDDLAYTQWLAPERAGALWVAWNNHDGTFTPELIDADLPWARDVKILHASDRQWPALTVSAYRAGHYVFARSGARRFLRVPISEPGHGSITHAVGTFDQYSRLRDLVTAQDGLPGSITLWQNMDSHVFEPRVTVPVNTASYVALADLNGNTLDDVIVAHSGGIAAYLFSEGPWTLSDPIPILTTAYPVVYVSAVDLTRDGITDVLAGGTFEGLFWVDGTQLGIRQEIDPLLDSVMFATAKDLNGDGRLDVVAVSLGVSMAINIYWHEFDGSWTTDTLAHGYGGRAVAVGDFRHDGRVQIAVASFNGNRIEIWDLPPH